MCIIANITPGKILYLSVTFPHDPRPKDKYFVFAGLDSNNNALLLKINSENNYTKTNITLREFQFRLKQVQYNKFLRYDSYLDCGTVWNVLTITEVIDQVTKDPSRIVGEALDDHKNEILRLVSKSKSISRFHKGIICKNFNPK